MEGKSFSNFDCAGRRHVKSDLRPYVCLMENCSKQYETFIETKDWLLHMESEYKEHIARWRCSAKHESPQVFSSEEEFVFHMISEHPRIATKSQLPIIKKRSGRPAPQMFENCPLCGWFPDDSQNGKVAIERHLEKSPEQAVSGQVKGNDEVKAKVTLNKHIAEHLQEIALRSLPEETFHIQKKSIRCISSSRSSAISTHTDLEVTQSEINYLQDPAHKSEEEAAIIDGSAWSMPGALHVEKWSSEEIFAVKATDWTYVYCALARIQVASSDLPNPCR
jgi:hypothetical protein